MRLSWGGTWGGTLAVALILSAGLLLEIQQRTHGESELEAVIKVCPHCDVDEGADGRGGSSSSALPTIPSRASLRLAPVAGGDRRVNPGVRATRLQRLASTREQGFGGETEQVWSSGRGRGEEGEEGELGEESRGRGLQQPATTQQLPYRVKGSITVPVTGAEPTYSVQNPPSVAIRFSQSHISSPGGHPLPVPSAIYEDAKATVTMAKNLGRMLQKERKASSAAVDKVSLLRDYISKASGAVIKETKEADVELTKYLKEHIEKLKGITGNRGRAGAPGKNGKDGDPGMPGPTGAQGAPGKDGVKGPKGPQGPMGPAGKAGPPGPRGPPGRWGKRGPRGRLGTHGSESLKYRMSMRNPMLTSFVPDLCPGGDNGVVRLADCTNKACVLTVLHGGHWGGVCDEAFTQANAAVVCSSLGFTEHRAEFVKGVKLAGVSGGKTWLSDVSCQGDEDELTDCKHSGWGVSDETCDSKSAPHVGICCRRF